jgi:glycosyltransferase involved in cell wall biosynthesis
MWTSPLKRWLRAKLIRYFADGFVALTNSHRQQLLDLGVPSEMLACIPNPHDDVGGNVAEWLEKKRSSSSFRPLRVVYVAALRKCKAQDVLVKAAASLIQRYPGVTFDLIGSAWPGEEVYEEELRCLITQLGLRDHVRLIGGVPHSEAMAALVNADIVAFPTLAEMMPRAVIEAMMLGKAVVASAVDGILDLIEHRRTGLLVKAGDVGGLARAISELIEDPALAAELGTAGQIYVRDFCAPERVGRLFCEFYTRCMQARA